MTPCDTPGCELECEHIVELGGAVAATCHLCGPCYHRAYGGWMRLQADARALAERGVPRKMLDRIMSCRVDRGEYGGAE